MGAKDFAQADMIREQLKGMGVEVWDKQKTWKQESTGLEGVILGYFGDRPPSDIEISALVIQREKARQKKNFELSDSIRDELKERNVQLYDKEGTWKCSDGRQGRIPSFQEIESGIAQPGRMPVAGVSGGSAAVGSATMTSNVDVQTALLQLAVANPQVAPQILSILPQVVNGGAAPPAVRPAPSARTTAAIKPNPSTLTSDVQQAVHVARQCKGRAPSDDEVTYLVQSREDCRQAKDYAGADQLRAEMKAIGLEVFDKEKIWKTTDGREGAVPTWG